MRQVDAAARARAPHPAEGRARSSSTARSSTAARRRRSRARSGLLPQSPVAPEGIAVADLVGRGRHPHQKLLARWSARDYEVVARSLEATGTADLADRSVDELSGGQRQRVWIAMALAQETDILLLDEPTTFLDVAHQVEVLDLLTDLNRDRGTTIVMVLHDINLAARYADHIFALRAGRLVASGTPGDVMTAELDPRRLRPRRARRPRPRLGLRPSSSPAAGTTSRRRSFAAPTPAGEPR